jgi:hypothetical protein
LTDIIFDAALTVVVLVQILLHLETGALLHSLQIGVVVQKIAGELQNDLLGLLI